MALLGAILLGEAWLAVVLLNILLRISLQGRILFSDLLIVIFFIQNVKVVLFTGMECSVERARHIEIQTLILIL